MSKKIGIQKRKIGIERKKAAYVCVHVHVCVSVSGYLKGSLPLPFFLKQQNPSSVNLTVVSYSDIN